MGAGGLNFRVRKENGCDPAAIATGKPFRTARLLRGAILDSMNARVYDKHLVFRSA